MYLWLPHTELSKCCCRLSKGSVKDLQILHRHTSTTCSVMTMTPVTRVEHQHGLTESSGDTTHSWNTKTQVSNKQLFLQYVSSLYIYNQYPTGHPYLWLSHSPIHLGHHELRLCYKVRFSSFMWKKCKTCTCQLTMGIHYTSVGTIYPSIWNSWTKFQCCSVGSACHF